MPSKVTKLEVTTARGITIRHALHYHETQSTKLLVLLPGRGYTNDSPAMYYLRKLAVGLGYDVLNVTYSFQYAMDRVGFADLTQEELDSEAHQAIELALKRGYEKVVLAGKSLGTPIAARMIPHIQVSDLRLILLTPIAGAVTETGDLPTLAIIGTADPAYTDDIAVNTAKGRVNVQWNIFQFLNHALEYVDDWEGSINKLKEILSVCEEFLRS